ncbi:MAG: hypothetical protein KTQ49_01025 [Candidatus Omnitrophica bacterium]|nr:hypothetical protein [Candidatus Omnitrophota bacterium]
MIKFITKESWVTMRRKNAQKWGVLFVSLFLLSAPLGLWAEEPLGDPFGPAAGAGSAPVAAEGSAEGVKIERTEEGKYYLDFKGATLINVLSVISSLSGINFIAGKEVGERQVNMTLDNVSLEDALQALRHGCNVNYDLVPGRNIYLFRASADAPEQPPLMTKVFKLHFIQASRIKDIETDSSGSGSSSSSSSSSSGGSTGGGLVTLKVDEEGPELDESAIYKAIEKILSERGQVSVDDRSNSLIVTDSEDRLNMVEAAIAQLDRPLDQVLINVLLVETYEDLDRELGVEWGDTNGVFGTITGAKQATTFPFLDGGVREGIAAKNIMTGLTEGFKNIPKQFNPTQYTGDIADDDLGSRDFSKFQISVKAMEQANKLKVLAKPKILVLDNHAAIIKIATDAAIGTTTSTQAGGAGTETNSTERSEIGTILRVIPLINTNDRITMSVEPTFATLDPSTIAVNSGGGQTGDPTVRTARTTLMLNDGQTIAIGGLLLSQQTNNNRKVPFFGNIPLIGKAFFTSNSKTIQDRELILFVTPYIIRDPSSLETPSVPDKRLMFEDERAPFWKVKQKEWYKELKEGPEKPRDYEQYFDVRKRLMNAALDTMSQSAATGGAGVAPAPDEATS